MRHQSNVPSSVISSHSMHLGVLATAWHAVTTGTMFTVYYKPRCVFSTGMVAHVLSHLEQANIVPMQAIVVQIVLVC